ncbi:hypothetical protein LOTGIDRAFT_224237 [Lottia gigantea]|uniref:Kynurenine/alpha-aminoadipate aminotransferase, mitochondrial n=1 Tax=Lottia gigantea TaxID=225164 RepID=V4AHQ7_LOTGI|nr:hypothetical protein LOTGIDRAFT_224237 [Lottia gigantea]ESP03599.1 hypothetical protein LOTGIDRAFT_224237 [Lottia gigantea]
MNYNRFLNVTSLSRKPSPIRVLTGILQQAPPSTISMAGGRPNPSLFPINGVSISLSNGTKLDIEPNLVQKALQYSATPGLSEMLDWIKMLQKNIHNPPTLTSTDENQKLDMLVIPGSQDGLCKAFEAMISKKDNVLIEIPSYSGTLAIVKPIGSYYIGVDSDEHGLIPGKLKEALSKWSPEESKNPNSDIPKLLYCIPNGGNPTGHSLTLQRKEEIYRICQDYDLFLIEDDPYYYLQYDQPYIPSFLSMDVDGRVLRFDSFSKLLSSGMRVGVVTGPKAIVNRIALHMQASVMHTSGISQVLMFKVLENMGLEGFKDHVKTVANFYKSQRDACIKAANKHLTGLVEWNVPNSGMFLWMKLMGVSDSFQLITEKAREKEVLFVPGNAFMLDSEKPCPYVRASFSESSPEDMDKAFQRLAEVLIEAKNN